MSITARTKCVSVSIAMCFLFVFAFSGLSQAKELRYSLGFPQGSAGGETGVVFADALEEYTDGELSVRLHYLALLSLGDMSEGVRDGIVDIGNVLAPYFPSEYPHLNMAAEVTMLLALSEKAQGRQGMAYAGAMAEFIMLNCPDCRREFLDQNQVYFTQGGTPEYQLMCTQPVRNADELRGKRLRVAGAQWSRWADAFGATGVSLGVHEVYEALAQGVVDCTVHSSPELGNFGLDDVVTDITVNVPGGVFSGGSVSVNLNTWREFTSEQRKQFIRAAALSAGDITWRFQTRGESDLQDAIEAGVEVHQPDEELVEASRKFIEEDLERSAASYARDGIDDADEKIDMMRPIVERWLDLMDEAEINSGEDLGNIYWEEVFSKIDEDTYGIEE